MLSWPCRLQYSIQVQAAELKLQTNCLLASIFLFVASRMDKKEHAGGKQIAKPFWFARCMAGSENDHKSIELNQ
jgi:hypothetical protein